MKKISKKKLLYLLTAFKTSYNESGKHMLSLTEQGKLDLRNSVFEHEDVSGLDFSNVDFSWSDFNNVLFKQCTFDNTVLAHTKFFQSDLSGSSFVNANLYGADLRGCNLSYSNCDGTDFTGSLLWNADISHVSDSDRTRFFRMYCPEKGYFFGYKKCFNSRMVKLLIPKDAQRCSGTTKACRCDKAKPVAITNIDGTVCYTEATSFVDGNFIYRLGCMAYADSYNPNRWVDSSHGIHFWMTFEEAAGYM